MREDQEHKANQDLLIWHLHKQHYYLLLLQQQEQHMQE